MIAHSESGNDPDHTAWMRSFNRISQRCPFPVPLIDSSKLLKLLIIKKDRLVMSLVANCFRLYEKKMRRFSPLSHS